MRAKTGFIHIGDTLHNDDSERKKIFLELREYGVIPVLGRSRFGKSALMKLITYEIVKLGRKIIVIDPFSEWGLIDKYNFSAESPRRIDPELIYKIEKPRFKISDLNKTEYWRALNFPEVASRVVVNIAVREEVHGNNIEKFSMILNDLPTNNSELDSFNSKYPEISLKARLADSTKNAAISAFEFSSGFFLHEGVDEEPFKMPFDQILDIHDVVYIDLGLKRGTSRAHASLLSAIILDLIGIENIERFHPVLILEEADYIVPAENLVEYSLSRNKLIEYSKKFQKFKVVLFFINQDSTSMSNNIIDNFHQKLLGCLTYDDRAMKGLERFRRFLKKRQFIYVPEDGKPIAFRTRDCPLRC